MKELVEPESRIPLFTEYRQSVCVREQVHLVMDDTLHASACGLLFMDVMHVFEFCPTMCRLMFDLYGMY